MNIRQQIETRQRAVRDQLASLNVPVTGSVTTVMNAIFVIATKDQVAALQSIPGVKGVVPVRRYQKSLNRALSLVDAPGAWNLVVGGAPNAGKGIKVGVLDDGIELTNPMFQAPSLSVPTGFPKCSGWDQAAAQCANYTNNKVIVARSYVKMLAGFSSAVNGTPPAPAYSRPDDYTPSGRDGHGTGVASIVGGVSATGTVTVNGVAPGVYLGNYKIYGSPGVNDSTQDDVIIAALEDAVHDGMDIVSFSSGGPALTGPLDACANVACDPAAYAFEVAAKAGLVIVAAAGNDGYGAVNYPNFNSIESPGDAPSVIAVGATSNSHYIDETVQVTGSGVPAGLQSILGTFSDAFSPVSPETVPLLDVATATPDVTGLACSTLPSGSLAGAFALIERSPETCTFAQKMSNAVAAGAAGVIFYMADGSPLINPTGLSNFDQPVVMISNSDGLALKSFIDTNPGRPVTINPHGREVFDNAGTGQNLLAGFSSTGPSTGDSAIKPDLVAVGEGDAGFFGGIYMAASTTDPLGALYSSDGFVAADGTSFATPMVAGAAAIVKQLHPTFNAAQVKSALVNTATQDVTTDDSAGFGFAPVPVDVQWLGGGKLDAGAAASATVTVNPPTLSFGAFKPGTLSASKQFTITNSGASTVNLSLVFASGSAATSVLSISPSSLSIGAGQSGTVTVTLAGQASTSPWGEYSGAVALTGAGVSLRVPYMFLVSDGVPFDIFPIMGDQNDGTVSQVIPDGALAFKITDDPGLPVAGLPVVFQVDSSNPPGSTLQACTAQCSSLLGAASSTTISTTTDQYGIAYAVPTFGSQPGTYTFTAGISGLTYTFTDRAWPAPAITDVVNNASYAVGVPVAPGSYVSIFGTGLSDTTDYAPSENLPLSIDLVNVSFDVPSANISLPGYLLYVSPGQVNVQVPWELQGKPSVQVKVTIDQTYGNVVTVPLSDYAPGLIEFTPGVAVAATDTSFKGIGSSNPAKRGQIISLYAEGLGPVTNQPATGQPALSFQGGFMSTTISTPTVTIGGQTAALACGACSGLSAGYPALYQINVVVPQSLSPGSYPVTVAIGGRTSKASAIMVQ